MNAGVQSMGRVIRQEATASAAASPPSPIAHLTRRMARGDEDAFREFFAGYFQRLFAYLLVITSGNEDLARELLQQTMLRVARHIRTFESENEFWRWLTVLARTRAVDETRKHRRYRSFLERLWFFRSSAPPSKEGEEAIRLSLHEELDRLPDEDRRILESKYIEGQSVREIAQLCGLSEKAIESRLTRARAKLKETLLVRLRKESSCE